MTTLSGKVCPTAERDVNKSMIVSIRKVSKNFTQQINFLIPQNNNLSKISISKQNHYTLALPVKN
jgi:hypothetical protein